MALLYRPTPVAESRRGAPCVSVSEMRLQIALITFVVLVGDVVDIDGARKWKAESLMMRLFKTF